MPSSLDSDIFARQQGATLSAGLEPAQNILNSLMLLNAVEKLSGLNPWIELTAAQLGPEALYRNKLVLEGMHYAVVPVRRFPSFAAYLDDLASSDPADLRERLLTQIAGGCWNADLGSTPQLRIDPAELLASREIYLNYLRANFDHIDEEIETETHGLLNDLPAMHKLIVTHLRSIWNDHVALEWERVKPVLQEAVTAVQRLDLSRLSNLEALRAVTGQEADEHLIKLAESAKQIIFVPSAHLGPYLRKFIEKDTLFLLFGARLPAGAASGATALSRSDLLVRLGAITDDTRLRILALLSQHDELCAQDIMGQLDLTQSATSRHLRQLSASGYVTERRREIAKCYTLNRERIHETFDALERFLSRQ